MRLKIISTVLFACCSQICFAWGSKGHQIVGDIAQEQLTSSALKALKVLMGDQVDLGKESNWPDEIRPNKAYARFRPWHYVDFPHISDVRPILQNSLSAKERPILWSGPEDTAINFIDSLRQFSDYLLVPHAVDGDAIQATNQMAWLLSSPRATHEERVFALRYLVHIVGDIHQPLHDGNGKDLGGNACQVIWKGKTHHTYSDGNTAIMNLHTVWDEELLAVRHCGSDKECDPKEYVKFLKKEYPATLKNTKSDDYPGIFMVAEWANEGASLRDAVYPRANISYCKENPGEADIEAKFRPELGDAYYNQHIRTLETQILKAGLRVAAVLNDLLPHVARVTKKKDDLNPPK